MRVGPKNVYVSDQFSILCFSRDSLTLSWRKGGKGEGPSQFRSAPNFRVKGERLFVSAVSQIALFTNSGELVKEKRHGKIVFQVDYLDEKYVASYSQLDTNKDRMGGTVYSIFGPDFKELKVLYTAAPEKETKGLSLELISNSIFFQTYKGKIYLANNEKGFHIDVLDASGNSIKQISRTYKKIETPESNKKRKIEWFKSRLKRVRRWASRKWNFTFIKYLPAMEDFRIVDDKIYIKTYHLSGQNVEFLVLDLDGKLLGKKNLPDVHGDFFDIKDNRFYYLVEDEDEESWVLHSLKILGK